MNEAQKDEIWLSHLRPHHNEWVALAGEYPHTLAGADANLKAAIAQAKVNGFDDVILFRVPPDGPFCFTSVLI